MSILPNLTSKLMGGPSVSKWRYLVRQIKAREHLLEPLPDLDLKKKSLALKYKILSGVSPDDLLIDAFALVRESARRTLQMMHYDVQLLGGIAMQFQQIIVMQTGEGKTLTATLPIYLNALAGKGAHLATANDYLAQRDAEQMAPLYQLLGLKVGVVTSDSSPDERGIAYQSDITYTTAKEIGFDFLRDRLQMRSHQNQNVCVVDSLLPQHDRHNHRHNQQRDHHFVLVDEADSILIDEARTPLIVSSLPDEVAQAREALYRWCAKNCQFFKNQQHWELNAKTKQLVLTAEGRRQVRSAKKPSLLNQTPMLDIYEQMELSIYVDQNYVRDRHYIVKDGEVVIVDEFTGRPAEGRKWKSGIHQAIEAREKLDISIETGESARITIQDLFLRYERIAGMTGTVGNSSRELKKIYNVGVSEIPTHRPSRRQQLPDLVFACENKKWEAIVDETMRIHATGRPVLIGTRSIDKSELLSAMLTEKEISHMVLNARNLAAEAEIVATAGHLNHVTVATNMAGRGTDIQLDEKALSAGGLHVICTELHESARIDRQLIGRCGRQGDAGSFRQFMSLEDDILKVGLGEKRFQKIRSRGQRTDDRFLDRLKLIFRKAQKKVEYRHFTARKMLMHQETIRHQLQAEMGQDPYLDVAGTV